MKIVRIHTGNDAQSHFKDIEVEFEPRGDTETTQPQGATDIIFRRAPSGYFHDFHVAPKRQYVITLSGEWEVEVGDGSVRRFGPGDILLAEDETGQGHRSRVLGSQPRVYAFVRLK